MSPTISLPNGVLIGVYSHSGRYYISRDSWDRTDYLWRPGVWRNHCDLDLGYWNSFAAAVEFMHQTICPLDLEAVAEEARALAGEV